MPLRLEIKKLLASRSERVKSCDLHPSEPWVLSALYSGHLFVWNYNTQTVVKSIEVSEQPIRCAKFVTRKQWIICGSDDMVVRVFNLNTLEKIAQFEAHADYIRCLEVHPSQPYVLSSSDDMQIKLWNWEANWACTQTFEGHSHYVMQVRWNPKDSNTFASASLDKSVKMWSIGSPLPNFSLEGHERGANCLDFYPGGDKPYLVSGADDKTLKIWDYQTKACVQTLEGHTSNVSAVCFHPKLPVILSGSEDGTVRMWHTTTYRLETTLNYGLERCWALAVAGSSNKVAIGYDEGTIVIGLGQEKPVVSVDSSGKVLMAVNNEISGATLRAVSTADGERVDLQTKELGACEVFPQKISHNNNGRFVAVCGDGEYIIYTAQALRNKSFGQALDFAWSTEGTGDYAVRESSSRLRVFKNFEEKKVFKPPFSAEGLFGGHLVAIAGSEFVVFCDWTELKLVMRIDVAPRDVLWSADGELVVLVCDESYFVLSCDLAKVNAALASGAAHPEDGVEGSFTLLHEIGEKVESGQWVGSCFLYTNAAGRLNYYVGGEVLTLSHLDRTMFLMGFVARENRVFLIDKNRHIVSYALLESVLQYQTAVVRRDFELANQLLATIPRAKYNDISRFLESQGFKEVALQVADDPDQKFELALQLEKLELALEIMTKEIVPSAVADDAETHNRWKQLGDLALARSNMPLAQECARKAADHSGLLLMAVSAGDWEGVQLLGEQARAAGRANVAFICALLLGDKQRCVDVLKQANRLAEAAFFARTYAPSLVAECTQAWKKDLATVNPRAAQALADPQEYPELFADMQEAQEAELIADDALAGKRCPAAAYPSLAPNQRAVLVDLLKEQGPDALKALFEHYQAAPGGPGAGAGQAAARPPQAPANANGASAKARQEHEAAKARQEHEAAAAARAKQEAEAAAAAQAQAQARARQEQEAAAAAKAKQEQEAHALAQAKAQEAAKLKLEQEAAAKAKQEEQARMLKQKLEAEEQARLAKVKQEAERLKQEAAAKQKAAAEEAERLRQEQLKQQELLRKKEAEAAAAAAAAHAAAEAAAHAAEDADEDQLNKELATQGADEGLEGGDMDLAEEFEDWS